VNSIEVRRLRPDDAREVGKISFSIIGGYSQDEFQKIIEKQALSVDDVSVVAVKDNQLLGYCISYVLPVSFGMVKSAWLALVAVHPDFMGQGIGKILAKEVLKHFHTLEIVNVYTAVKWGSTDLISFFKILGFQRSDFVCLQKNSV